MVLPFSHLQFAIFQANLQGAHRLVTPPDDPFSASLETLTASRIVGLDSAYIAAQEALQCFKELPEAVPTAFIYTGNALSQIAIPGVLPFAMPKVAAMMMIEYGANAYGHKGYRYVFVTKRIILFRLQWWKVNEKGSRAFDEN